MKHKHLKYDIRKGVRRVKTKTFFAISVLGLMIGGSGISLFVLGTANASSPGVWELNAPSAITFNCGSVDYAHTLNTVSNNNSTGNFTGAGNYIADPSYMWSIDGNITGNGITFHVLYTGSNPGYTLNGIGSIDNDGSVSGTVDNNCSSFSMPAGSAVSVQNPKLDWKSNVQCTDKVGAPVVNVTQKVKNDADSGTAGNAWAMDNYNRHIQVWKTSATGTESETYYCATVTYDGSFNTLTGPSPQNTGTVGAGVTGDFEGGYLSTHFTGTLRSIPTHPTHGNIGTFNYNCDTSFNCLGYVDWTGFYFSGTSGFGLAWWGWQYDTCNNGNWINAISGNFGDITGNVSHKDKCHEDKDHHDNDGDHGHHGDGGHHDKDKHHLRR